MDSDIGAKSEMLFSKNTKEYYYWVSKNMYKLSAFVGMAEDFLVRLRNYMTFRGCA